MIPKLPKGYTHPMAIGEGAFSAVYRARQTSLDRWVALKMLKEKDPAKRAEQLKEARIQAELHLRCTPEVFDVSEWKNQILIVMQWVHGIPLSRLDFTQLTESQKLGLAEAILLAVAELHQSGHTHGDLKPDNILISPDEGVYLIDFGFSRPSVNGLTSGSGIIRGTPAYMAPEIKFGRCQVDHYKAELFSLGKILEPLLQNTSASDWPNPLLSENTDERPDNGGKALELWAAHFPGLSVPVWALLTAQQSAKELSEKLYRSAQQLIQGGKLDEAYWLITECLEHNSNHASALSLMENFSELQTRAKRKTTTKVILAGCAATLMAVGFLAGFWRANQQQTYLPKIKVRHSLLAPTQGPENSFVQKKAHLKPPINTQRGFDASIHIPILPKSGTLAIDGITLSPSRYGSPYPVSQGEHTITWKRHVDNVRWTTNLKLLPFQTQSFSIPKMYLK